MKVIKSSKILGVTYIALRVNNDIICNIVYKGKCYSELSNPNFYTCPLCILRLLTPCLNEKSRAWRDECFFRHEQIVKANRLEEGQIIVFDKPVACKRGMENTFRYCKYNNKLQSFHYGNFCYIRNWKSKKWECVL